MGYIFDFNDANAYEQWFYKHRNRPAAELESRLMIDLLKPNAGELMLDIGCGIGSILPPLLDAGLQITGIDPSPYMLDIICSQFNNRVELYRGNAEDLPFDDNSFNHACFFSSLEFVDDPKKAIKEACRVAKDKVFIGVLNRFAIKGIQRRVQGIFNHTIFNKAEFFSVWQIKRMVRELMGPVPITWRTVCQFPNTSGKFFMNLERSQLVQRCPFGTFAGIVVTLVPRFRTRPLALRYRPKRQAGITAT